MEITSDIFENGLVTTKMVEKTGLKRGIIGNMVRSGELIKLARGIYLPSDEWEDEYASAQLKYRRGIYSHATALYLHGYSQRVPLSLHMTFPTNYNSQSLKSGKIIITRVKKENYELGITTVVTPSGNTVKAYDIERSLCDVLRGAGDDIQIIQFAMKKYAQSKERDINKLMSYAARLHVEPKVRRYMEVLL